MDGDDIIKNITDIEINDAETYRAGKNTAILVMMFIDAVKSTELLEEKGSVEYLKIQRSVKNKLTSIIEQKSEGKVIKDLGDGLLAVFAVPGVAVERALDIQEILLSEPEYKVRIGLDMGQVISESKNNIVKDVFGRHVNRAARLEKLSDAGHIMVSYTVWDSACGWLKHLDFIEWERHGSYKLKGITEPQTVYEPYNKTLISPIEKINGVKVSSDEVSVYCKLCGSNFIKQETFKCSNCGEENICKHYCYDSFHKQCIKCTAKKTSISGNTAKSIESKNWIRLKNPQAEFFIKIWTESKNNEPRNRDIMIVPKNEFSQYRIGDEVNLNFESSADAFIYIFNIGPTGNITQLLPNQYMQDNKIKAGVIYKFPDENSNFSWILQEPAGTETIKAFATKRSIDINRFINDQTSSSRTRDISVVVEESADIKYLKWTEALCKIIT